MDCETNIIFFNNSICKDLFFKYVDDTFLRFICVQIDEQKMWLVIEIKIMKTFNLQLKCD